MPPQITIPPRLVLSFEAFTGRDTENQILIKYLLDQVPSMVFVKDAASRVIFINRACEQQWGATLDELVLTDGGSVFPPEQIETFVKKDQEIFANGTPQEFQEVVWSKHLGRNIIGQTTKQPFYDDQGKPSHLVCVTVDITDQIKSRAETKRAHKAALVALANLAEFRDNDTGEHVLRVARMAHEISRELSRSGPYSTQIDATFRKNIGIASILHDIGKVGIPDGILLKPGKLSPEERSIMERHALIGGSILRKTERLLETSEHFNLAYDIALYHHESWEGGGYPHGLAGTNIPLSARIVAISDVYDALISKRPYKEAWSSAAARDYIRSKSGTQFDPYIVEAFNTVLANRDLSRFFEWTDAIAIGHPSIDHDHKVLLALVNQITAPENRSDPDSIEFVLDELVGYTSAHFDREEEIMAASGYTGLANHQELHRRLVADVKLFKRRFEDQAGLGTLGEDLCRFLTDWLITHIMHEDHAFAPYVIPQQSQQNPHHSD